MKTIMIIALALSASLNLAVAQEVPASAAVQGKVAALNQKYPVLFDAESDAKEALCEAAIAQLKDDAELATLKSNLNAALAASPRDSAQISSCSQALQAKQFEKIVALRPEVRAYLEAKANHQRERAALLREYANDAAAQRVIAEGTKRKR